MAQSGRGHTSSFTTRCQEKYKFRVHAATIVSYSSVCAFVVSLCRALFMFPGRSAVTDDTLLLKIETHQSLVTYPPPCS